MIKIIGDNQFPSLSVKKHFFLNFLPMTINDNQYD